MHFNNCWGPAPAGSRGTLRRDGFGIRKERQRERERERERERMTWGDQALVSEAHNFIFKRNFYTLTVHRGKWKMQCHAESAQTLHLFCLYQNQDFFLHTFPINNVVYIIFWPWRPVDILWLSFDKGCSTRKLIFPWNVFSYISNLCQPQKVLNRVTFSRSKGAVSYKKEPISSKVWCG